MNNKAQLQRNIADQKEKMARDAAKYTSMWRGLDNNPDEEIVYSNRHEVPIPVPLDQSKYNPNNIVDIVTFVTHPHYLNLKPYPWQTLALKLFYAGSEGNTCLEFNEVKKEEVTGCSDCVWNYIVENETECAKKIENGDTDYLSILEPLNSRCLGCSRCPLSVRKTRLSHELTMAGDKDKEELLTKTLEDEPDDLFQSEIDLIEQIPDEAVKLQIRNKFRNKFQDLVLVIGRRGTKSFMTCAIALYEIYKLLSMGHPQKKLKLPDFQEIHILNVAKNEDQARDSIFTPMKNYAVASPFFQEYIGVDNALEMKFLTKADLEENKRREAKGLAKLDGTIIAKCGSSSATGLVGKTCWCIILDELAAMAGDNPNSGLDKKLYNELKPSLATFGKEGKIISLSNPKGPFGQLYHLYNSRLDHNMTLVLKLPTWLINANVDKLWLESERQNDPIEYNMQYGAEFGSNSANPFLTPEDVSYAFENSSAVTRLEKREPNVEYYCHVDPSNRSDYYAVVVVHAIPTGDLTTEGKRIKRFVVDHVHFWAPVQLKQPVQPDEVEKYILDLHKRFQFKQISFDQWHSSEMLVRLANQGLPVILKVFNKEYKDKIYMSLLEVFRSKRIEFYKVSGGKVLDKKGDEIDINEIPEAKNQFTFLQKKWRNGRQIIEALTGYKDDICDATAAAVFECDHEEMVRNKLPKARIVYTGARFR